MKALAINDLTVIEVSDRNENEFVRLLSVEEMKCMHGGRAVSVLIDGRPGGVIDDFQLNLAIFKGDIGVKVV